MTRGDEASRSGWVVGARYAGVTVGMVALALAVYAVSLDGPFFFDDHSGLVDNPNVRVVWPLDIAMSAPRNTPFVSRPLVSLTASLNYAVSGLDPWSFRLVNVVLHGLAGAALFALMESVFGLTRLRDRATRLALVVAVLWLIHPINSDAVAYVTQRSKVMLGLFAFLMLGSALRGFASQGHRRWWYTLATVSCFAGMMSKESMFGMPIFLLLMDRQLVSGSFLGALRAHRGLYLWLGVGYVLLAVLMVSAPREESVGWHLGMSPWLYLLTQSEVVLHYLRLLVWPFPLLVHHEWRISPGLAESWLTFAVMLSLLGLTVLGLIKRHWLGLVGAGVILALGPTSTVIPMTTEVVAERRMYLPSAALIATAVVVVGWGMGELPGRWGRVGAVRVGVGVGLVCVVAGLLVARTVDRLEALGTRSAIWTPVMERYPESWLAVYNLALAKWDEGDRDPEMVLARRAYALEPAGEIQSSLMMIQKLRAQDRDAEAWPYVEALLLKAPDDPAPWVEQARLLMRADRLAEAVESANRAIQLGPTDALSRRVAGEVALRAGDPAAALVNLEDAVVLNPFDAQSHFWLGLAYLEVGRIGAARAAGEYALQLDPSFTATRELLREVERAEDRTPGR
ncbi:MAG: tetratricopeptide repeat protein [Planctomycetota bacterium]